MDTPQGEREQRKSFRCPASGSGKEGELLVGDRRFQVRLHDQSAGGFAVDADRRIPVRLGDVLRLSLDTTLFEVRVAHVASVEVDPPGPHANRQVGLRIGLQRLRELVVRATDRPDIPPPTFDTTPLRAHTGGLGLALTLAVAVVIVPLVGICLFLHAARPSPKAPSGSSEATGDQAVARGGYVPAAEAAGRGDPAPLTGEPGGIAGPTTPPSELRRLLSRPGASGFRAAEVASVLRLTDEQREGIRRIVDQTAEDFQRLDEASGPLTRAALDRRQQELLHAARRRAEALLTEEQLQRLAALLADSLQPGSP